MTNSPLTPSDLEAALDGCWVVLIWDPDDSDTSPYSVVAPDIGEAVRIAVADWEAWQIGEDDPDTVELGKPSIFKVYRNSWITEIAWYERMGIDRLNYDKTKLSNPH